MAHLQKNVGIWSVSFVVRVTMTYKWDSILFAESLDGMKRMTVLKKWKENGNGNKRNEKNIIRRLPPLKKRRSYYGKIKKKIPKSKM
jgi:hypothetical protein